MHKTDNFKSLVLHKTYDFKSPFLHKTDNFCHSQKGIRLPPRLLPLIASTAVTPGEAFGEEDGDSCDCRTPAMWASCARSRNKYDKARPGKEDLDGRKERKRGISADLLGGLLALGRLLGVLALRHNPELEQRVADNHGEQGVDHGGDGAGHGGDGAGHGGVHAPALA